MPEAGGDARQAQPLCASSELAERSLGFGFDVLLHGEPVRAFALRIDGRVVAYVNRCAHVAAEMDWQPGHFLDDEGRFIVCSIHGAEYDPRNGRCAGGPCGRGRLVSVDVCEADGQVYWYPSRAVRPLVFG